MDSIIIIIIIIIIEITPRVERQAYLMVMSLAFHVADTALIGTINSTQASIAIMVIVVVAIPCPHVCLTRGIP